ncbi:MAG TPA: outer membrane beta-barrel protein [Steroidobacteraceae bacterium]|nr:outer membrane beta-barrel protein [Steroidobacteraceae bacterium]
MRMRPLACLMLLAAAAGGARADDLTGPYVGAAFGKAWLDAADGLISGFGSDKHASELIVGWRPIPELAAELEYINFGSSTGTTTYPNSNEPLDSTASRKGLAAFGVLYLPAPLVDFYVKAGVAKLHTRVTTLVEPCPTGGTCPPLADPIPVDSTGVGLAGGGGVMYRFRRLQVRFDYARFAALGGNPYLMTFGLTYTF